MCNEKQTRTYLLEMVDGSKQKVTVPDDWKVTFGPVAVPKGEAHGVRMPMALRFYEQESKQRAIFTNVSSFRDMSIPIEVEKVSHQDKVARMEVDGVVRNVNMRAEVREWKNPDEVVATPDIPKLMASAEPDWQ